MSDRAGLITRMNEEIEMLELNETDFGIKIQRDTIEMLSEKIELIDTEMEIELTKDISIKKNFDLLNTIVGIGKITAYQLIITTENFIKFDNPRKYASYAGVAPFTKQSGKSEGRTKVSGLANKKVKSLLDMFRSAMLNDPELKLYYKERYWKAK
ncbi:MAG: IS110 family transposase [Bacteroidetes bacterium]|nr:IS110 family transposase [Bacteroidota bacterium]